MVDAARRDGWPALFAAAFRRSTNAMALVDDSRHHIDVNGAYARLVGYAPGELIGRPIWSLVVDGPVLSPEEWAAALAVGHFTGQTELIRANGATVAVQWGADVVTSTDRRLVLFVALSTSRWGAHFRREATPDGAARLSAREREIVELVALGDTGVEIAQKLHIGHETVRTHVRNAMTRLGARSRAQLVAKAMTAGLIAT
jgi:PAS domain S-box-containing protein